MSGIWGFDLPPGCYDGDGEGHVGWFPNRRELMVRVVSSLKPRSVIEVGFNMGHSAQLIIGASGPGPLCFVSSDVCSHPYVEGNWEAFRRHYNDVMFVTLKGDSARVLPRWLRDHPMEFDLAVIDGSHLPAAMEADWLNVSPYVRVGGVVWLDDYRSSLYPHNDLDAAMDRLDTSGWGAEVHDGVKLLTRVR